MGSHDTSLVFREDPKAWMKKTWSIRILVCSSTANNYVCYSTAQPFEASPEEAQQALEDLRAKIMSICVSNTSPAPLNCFERQAGGELPGKIEDYWVRDRTLEGKARNRRLFFSVIDECLIPAHVLKTSIVRVSLLEELG